MDANTELLTIDETARRLRVSRATIYRAVRRGTLPGYRLGSELAQLRIRTEDADAFLEPTHSKDAA